MYVERISGLGGFRITVDSNVQLPVCTPANPTDVDELGASPIFPFTAYAIDVDPSRSSSEHLQSPTLGPVECRLAKPMRGDTRRLKPIHMDPLDAAASASLGSVAGLDWNLFTVPDHIDTSAPVVLSVLPQTGGAFGVSGVEYSIYTWQGELIQSGSGTATVVQPATFELPTDGPLAIEPGGAYDLRTGVSARATDYVDIELSATLPKSQGQLTNHPPAVILDFENNLAVKRLQLSPSGQIASNQSRFFGHGAFWVGQAGIAGSRHPCRLFKRSGTRPCIAGGITFTASSSPSLTWNWSTSRTNQRARTGSW